MRILTLPGVFRPISDTWLLAGALRELAPGARVLDVCTGSGALAVTAALAGAGDVTAVDVSRRAVLTAGLNARLNGVAVRARRSDLFAQLHDQRYDVIVCNPPYVPDPSGDRLPARGPQRAWDAGHDGRVILDRLIAQAPRHLHPSGALLVVHSELCGTDETLDGLGASGLDPRVVRRHRGPLGPLMRDRADHLLAHGVLAPGQTEEEVVVIAGVLPAAGAHEDQPVSTSSARPASTTSARMLASIMRSAARPSSSSMCATASRGTVTSKWRM
jgi:release factor glutamine methyltransferase